MRIPFQDSSSGNHEHTVKFSAQPSNNVIVNGNTQIEFDNVAIDTP